MSQQDTSEHVAAGASQEAEERLFNRPTRFGAQLPSGWVTTPEYLGRERRDAERRRGLERRAFSRLGDGRVPRRRIHGRRFDEVHGSQYRGLFSKQQTES